MKTLIILTSIFFTACGTNLDRNDSLNVAEEQEIWIINMCQVDSEGDIVRNLEFEVNEQTMEWIACYGFRPCEGEPELFTEEQIQEYEEQFCSNR